ACVGMGNITERGVGKSTDDGVGNTTDGTLGRFTDAGAVNDRYIYRAFFSSSTVVCGYGLCYYVIVGAQIRDRRRARDPRRYGICRPDSDYGPVRGASRTSTPAG